jgi:hypothetical protein
MAGFDDELLILRGPSGVDNLAAATPDGVYRGGMGTVADASSGGTTAFLFNNASHAITVGDNFNLPTTGEFAVFSWLYIAGQITDFTVFGAKQSPAPDLTGWALRNGGAAQRQHLSFFIIDGESDSNSVVSESGVFTGSGWRLIGVTYSAVEAVATIRLYHNGWLSVIPTSIVLGDSYANTVDCSFGQRYSDGGGPLSGRMDDIRIFSAIPSDSEIAAWQSAGRGYDVPSSTRTRRRQPAGVPL